MIECRHLTKRFGDFVAVSDVSFRLSRGICALLGHNGAGKSTLLKLLTGLLNPDEGQVSVAGFDVRRQLVAMKRAIGVLPEDLGLFDSLTVMEHLELCGSVYRLSGKQTRERAAFLIRVLGLRSGAETFLDQCSRGMRKKTALAMALIHNPGVLLLDEPFEGIDPLSAKTIEDLLRTLARQGVTIFIVSHLLTVVERLANEVLMMRRGNIVWHSAIGDIPRPLEQLYFDLAEPPAVEDLTWLRSSPS